MAEDQERNNGTDASEPTCRAASCSPLERFLANARRNGFQYTLREFLVVVGLFALVCGLTRWSGSPKLATASAVAFVAWMMVRFAHACVPGVLIFLVGGELLAVSAVNWVYYAREEFLFPCREMLGLIGCFLVLVSSIAFIVAAVMQKKERKWQLGNAMFVFLLMIVWFAVVPALGRKAVTQRRARETVANNAAMRDAVAQVEAVRKQLGRAPTAYELRELSGKPLPTIRSNGLEIEIRYQRVRDDQYNLRFVDWDIFWYDSATPEKGWYRIPW